MIYTQPSSDPILTLVEHSCEDIFIGCISFPTKKFTIEQYEAWEHSHTQNMLCLTQPWKPETIQHSGIKQLTTFNSNANFNSGIDYRTLITILLTKKHKDFFDYEKTIYNYFKQFEEPCLTSP